MIPPRLWSALTLLAALAVPVGADWMWQSSGPLMEAQAAPGAVPVPEAEGATLVLPPPLPAWSDLEDDAEPGPLPAALMEAAARSEQLSQAVESYQATEYAQACRTCKRFLRQAEAGTSGPLAQFLWAASEFRRGELNRSYDLFEDLERKFPASELGPRIARWELAIASRFLGGHKEKLLGFRIRDMRADATVILERLVERYPYGQLTDRLLARLGDCCRAARDYAQAMLYYDRLLRDFPRSPAAREAEFSRLECLILDCSGPTHDVNGLREAEQGLQAFLSSHPGGPRVETAQRYLGTVREMQAEHAFRVAGFYVVRQRWEAARRYFRLVRESFPDTRWAEPAARRLDRLTPPPLVANSEEPSS